MGWEEWLFVAITLAVPIGLTIDIVTSVVRGKTKSLHRPSWGGPDQVEIVRSERPTVFWLTVGFKSTIVIVMTIVTVYLSGRLIAG